MPIKKLENARVLVVCSRPDDISVYERMLQSVGFKHTIAAHSSETALSIIENEQINLVLIDNNLYPEGGLKLLVLIKRSYPTLPCVLVVRQDEVQTAVQALGMGGDDYLLRDEVFTIAAAQVLRPLITGESPRTFDDEGPRTVFGLLRKVLLLARRMTVHFSFQPGWESITNEVVDIFEPDVWGYLLERDYGFELHRFESAPLTQEGEQRLINRLAEVYSFHTGASLERNRIEFRTFQLLKSNDELNPPFRDTVLPLFAEGRCVGLLFLLYKNPAKLTLERVELLEFLASIMSYTLEMGAIFNRLTQLAMYDETTECYNRTHFLRLLEIETTRVERYQGLFSMVLVDLDDFKNVNKNYGYEAGNQILSQTASLLREQIRTIDIVARIGGEEFAVILPSTDLNGAKRFAERIREIIENYDFEIGQERTARITATLAVGQYQPKVHSSGEGLLARLERMLALKHDVKNAVLVET